MQPKNNQNLWNFLFSILFLLLLGGAALFLKETLTTLPRSIPLADFLLLTLAVFRLTRLFVYDKITRWFRELFMERRDNILDGKAYIERIPFTDGPRRTISDLLSCPWCISVWFALLLTFFYFLSPLTWYFILVLALSGVAALFQLFANLLGWSAEFSKLATEEKTRP